MLIDILAMYTKEKQRKVLDDLQSSLETTILELESWQNHLVIAQSYETASSCKGLIGELSILQKKINSILKIKIDNKTK